MGLTKTYQTAFPAWPIQPPVRKGYTRTADAVIAEFAKPMAGAAGIITCAATEADSHGFAGARFFPATIATGDPFVADELALPTVAFFKDSGDVNTSWGTTNIGRGPVVDW